MVSKFWQNIWMPFFDNYGFPILYFLCQATFFLSVALGTSALCDLTELMTLCFWLIGVSIACLVTTILLAIATAKIDEYLYVKWHLRTNQWLMNETFTASNWIKPTKNIRKVNWKKDGF